MVTSFSCQTDDHARRDLIAELLGASVVVGLVARHPVRGHGITQVRSRLGLFAQVGGGGGWAAASTRSTSRSCGVVGVDSVAPPAVARSGWRRAVPGRGVRGSVCLACTALDESGTIGEFQDRLTVDRDLQEADPVPLLDAQSGLSGALENPPVSHYGLSRSLIVRIAREQDTV